MSFYHRLIQAPSLCVANIFSQSAAFCHDLLKGEGFKISPYGPFYQVFFMARAVSSLGSCLMVLRLAFDGTLWFRFETKIRALCFQNVQVSCGIAGRAFPFLCRLLSHLGWGSFVRVGLYFCTLCAACLPFGHIFSWGHMEIWACLL